MAILPAPTRWASLPHTRASDRTYVFLNERLDPCKVVGKVGHALGQAQEVTEAVRESGPDTCGLLDRIGELGRVGSGQGDNRNPGVPSTCPGCQYPDSTVRVQHDTGPVSFVGDARKDLVVVEASS